ncbi:MAG: DUF423 domain-containing protein [Bacteroidia bacterium]|nr:DUF423 domain-containing protein [Bacteroidia bacterium]
MDRIALIAGSLYGFSGIILGAFGAHALKSSLSLDALASFTTGTRYQIYHALLLLALGILIRQSGKASKWLSFSVWGTILGTLLFSGSIYLLTLAEAKGIGFVTPLGGLLMILAWGSMTLHFILNKAE